MTLAEKIADDTTSVFLNLDQFAESYTFESNAAADIDFVGLFDRSTLKQTNTDDATTEQADGYLTIAVATLALFQAAVDDFEQDGWLTINGQRFSIAGEVERDSAMVTVALMSSKLKTLRKVKPHK